jgi:hypothetical protein
MQLNNILFMLLGAALVAAGVLSSALADRIRGVKIVREAQPRERASRGASAVEVRAVDAVPVAAPAELRATPAKVIRARADLKPVAATEGGEDVIAALVGSGYKRPIATEATWACTAAERATVEGWTASALRRCARGGLS